MRAYTCDTDLSGIQEILQRCRRVEPLAAARDVAALVPRKAPGWKRRGTFIGYCLTALPKALAAPGALAELRASPPPAEAPHGALDPEAEYYELGAQLEALPPGHENRPALDRRRDELRQELRARAEKARRR